jgi:hypothetical protein
VGFHFNVYNGLKIYPCLFEAISLDLLLGNPRNFTLLNVGSECRNYPSARCTSATSAISRDFAYDLLT